MSESESGVSWLHRLATLVAVMTFLLFMTGMLVSGTTGALFALPGVGQGAGAGPSAVTGGTYAYLYHFFAVAVCVSTVVLTFLMSRSNSRRYLKILALVTTGVLIGLAFVVLSPLREMFPAAISLGYTCGIQIFFCLTVCLALFTRTDWRWNEPKTPDLASPSVRQILAFATAAIFLQPLLGEAFQVKQIGIAPHLVLGIAVTVCSLWVLEMALTKYSSLRTFKISAIFFAELVGLELFLGIIAYSMNMDARTVPGPHPGLIVMNVTHATVGALALATSLFVTFQAFKYFMPAESRTSSAMLHNNRDATPQQQD